MATYNCIKAKLDQSKVGTPSRARRCQLIHFENSMATIFMRCRSISPIPPSSKTIVHVSCAHLKVDHRILYCPMTNGFLITQVLKKQLVFSYIHIASGYSTYYIIHNFELVEANIVKDMLQTAL
jgi:hypothetical protein